MKFGQYKIDLILDEVRNKECVSISTSEKKVSFKTDLNNYIITKNKIIDQKINREELGNMIIGKDLVMYPKEVEYTIDQEDFRKLKEAIYDRLKKETFI